MHTDAAAHSVPKLKLTAPNLRGCPSYISNNKSVIIMPLIWVGSNQLKTEQKDYLCDFALKLEQAVRHCIYHAIGEELVCRKSI